MVLDPRLFGGGTGGDQGCEEKEGPQRRSPSRGYRERLLIIRLFHAQDIQHHDIQVKPSRIKAGLTIY
jgi:hypothetical protein